MNKKEIECVNIQLASFAKLLEFHKKNLLGKKVLGPLSKIFHGPLH